jgi:hypothetical protein
VDQALSLIVASLGGGGFSLAILYMVRGAIATAITQAANREMETLKAKFAEQLEEKRQAFAQDLERERHLAASALEEFKADLTLKAETRRHVASKRVEAVGAILAQGDELDRMVSLGATDDLQRSRIRGALSAFTMLIRRSEHLFPVEAAKGFSDYVAKIAVWNTLAGSPLSPALESAFNEFRHAREQLVPVARRALEVEDDT